MSYKDMIDKIKENVYTRYVLERIESAERGIRGNERWAKEYAERAQKYREEKEMLEGLINKLLKEE